MIQDVKFYIIIQHAPQRKAKKEGRLHQVSAQTRKEEQRKPERQNRYTLVQL